MFLAASHCCVKLYRICPKCAKPIAKRSVRLLQLSFDSLQAEQQVGRLHAKQQTDRLQAMQQTDRTELRIASRAAGRHATSRPADRQAAGKAADGMARFALAISIYEQQPYVSFAMSIAHDIPKRANSDFDSAAVTTKRGRINVDSLNYCLNSISCLVERPRGTDS